MTEYTPEMIKNAEDAGHHANAEYMRGRATGNVRPLQPRTEFQYRSQLAEDAKQFGEAKFRQGYAVGRFDGYKAAAAFAGPVLLVGVGIGVIIAVLATTWS